MRRSFWRVTSNVHVLPCQVRVLKCYTDIKMFCSIRSMTTNEICRHEKTLKCFALSGPCPQTLYTDMKMFAPSGPCPQTSYTDMKMLAPSGPCPQTSYTDMKMFALSGPCPQTLHADIKIFCRQVHTLKCYVQHESV